MHDHGLRDIIVTGLPQGEFGILTVSDIIRRHPELSGETPLEKLTLRRCLCERPDRSVQEVVARHGIAFDYLCLVEGETLKGIVSRSDIIANYDPKLLAEFERIGNLLNRQKLNFVPYEMRAADAIPLLSDDLDDALIVQRDGKPVGIVTARDVLEMFARDVPLDHPIGEYMSAPLKTLNESATIRDAFEFMRRHRFKRAIIANDEGRIVGIVTQKELTRLLHNKWLEISRKSFDLAKRAAYFEEIAMHDPLTGAYNRNKFQEVVAQEIERIRRYGIEHFSLIMTDLDDFKRVNDTYGHDVGDRVLIRFAELVRDHLRRTDLLFRWGGEEFLLFLPQTDCIRALSAAEKIRELVAISSFDVIGRMTGSFGVAGWRDDEAVEATIKRADMALYAAKENGKNRVESGCGL
jgi:diguanylate cyclase (GGDEF)-like protein